jgi:hypothetical protein
LANINALPGGWESANITELQQYAKIAVANDKANIKIISGAQQVVVIGFFVLIKNQSKHSPIRSSLDCSMILYAK